MLLIARQGISKSGYRFRKPDDAKRALQQVNGLEIAGRQIKVGLVNENNGVPTPGALGELDDEGM